MTIRPPAPTCAWCGDPIPTSKRRDARFCRQSCRQAAHRFGVGADIVLATNRLLLVADEVHRQRTMAYLDPPYPGRAHLYRGHPDYAGEVDHQALITHTHAHYPDGWALSTAADSLPDILELCPHGVRVAAWIRGPRHTSAYDPLASWEPVIYWPGRRYLTPPGERLDSLIHGVSPRHTDPGRVIGAKPAAFCYWTFTLLGALPGDTIVDVFPGSGGVARAWGEVNRRHALETACRDGSAQVLRDASTRRTVDSDSPITAHQ